MCSYDRGGYAWSDPGAEPRTFSQLALELHTVELKVKLDVPALDQPGEPGEELFISSDANTVGVQQNVIDPRVVLNPPDQFKKPGVQRRLAAGKLQDFDPALAVHNPLNPPLQILHRHRIHLVAVAGRRIRVTGRAGEIARVDDFDQRQAGRKFFKGRVAPARRVAAQRAGHRTVGGTAGRSMRRSC